MHYTINEYHFNSWYICVILHVKRTETEQSLIFPLPCNRTHSNQFSSALVGMESVCFRIRLLCYATLPCFSKKFILKKEREAFRLITAREKKPNQNWVSGPGQSNNGQASRRGYREPVVSLSGRWRLVLSECSRNAAESKKFHWSSIPREGDPHRNFCCAIRHTGQNEKWFLTLQAE